MRVVSRAGASDAQIMEANRVAAWLRAGAAFAHCPFSPAAVEPAD
jgi:hypothetical protein